MIKPVAGPAPRDNQIRIGVQKWPRGEAQTREEGAILAESRARAAAVSCEDCFFRRRGLCALGLDAPCPTFRPDTPDGLVPPRQPALLMRHRREQLAAPAFSRAA